MIKQYETGGTFEKTAEARIGRAGEKATASGMQALVSSGLAGTSIAAGLGKKFEEEVGQPARLEAQDIASQRTAQALEKKAGFIERREDVGPDFATIAGLAQTIGTGQKPEEGAGGQPGGATDSSRITGTATPLGPISPTTVTSTSPRFQGLGGGGGGGGLGERMFAGESARIAAAFAERVSKPMTSLVGKPIPKGKGGRMPGQGKGTFFMKLSPEVKKRQEEKRRNKEILALGQGPLTPAAAQKARTKPSLMQQADPFNISGRFS